jgi:hypothetical protein
MRRMVSLVAAAALLASVGAADAKDPTQASVGAAHAKSPMKLTDVQLDKATAGDAASLAATELSTLMAITNWTLGWLSGVPQPLPPPNAMALIATP